MKYFSIIITLAMGLSVANLSYADGHGDHASAAPKMLKYTEFNQIGNPADVIYVKEEAPQALQPGDVRVSVLAAPINPSNLLQIAGQYGVDAVLPAKPGSEGVGRVIEVTPEVGYLKV